MQFGLAQVLDARAILAGRRGCLSRPMRVQAVRLPETGPGLRPRCPREIRRSADRSVHPRAFARARGFGSNSERPVFIVGMPRSGTSLTEQILASHPLVFGAGETRLVRETWDALPRRWGEPSHRWNV